MMCINQKVKPFFVLTGLVIKHFSKTKKTNNHHLTHTSSSRKKTSLNRGINSLKLICKAIILN